MAQVVRYELTVTLVRPIRSEEHDPAYPEAEHLASYVDADTKRRLEREVIRALRVVDGDADCEVMEAIIASEA